VRFVTHGGQVGAPFAQASAPSIDCDTHALSGFNNACIRGEYNYIRHGKGKPFHFHASSNGHVHEFDSLMCACLPCDDFTEYDTWGGCHPKDRKYNSTDPLVPGKHFGLCNPGDRACGPEPRPAPANKLCFSGASEKFQSTVFRVDIEDRGEPGNAHAIGSSGKDKLPDRYRIRLWFVPNGTAIDDLSVLALRQAVACVDPTDERVAPQLPCNLTFKGSNTTPPPDIDDGGDLDRGNRQIHPNTGATCK
jgi:hypothetical protein